MTFDLGGNKFNGQPFGLCTEHEGDFYTDKELDGFLGFGIDSELKTSESNHLECGPSHSAALLTMNRAENPWNFPKHCSNAKRTYTWCFTQS